MTMFDNAMIPALRAAIRNNEIGTASPYALSFAKLGQSGASFGIFQGDTNVSPEARQTLQAILAQAGADPATVARVMAGLSQPCPNGNPLDGPDTACVAAALDAPAGRAAVDAMDGVLLQVVEDELASSLAAAAARQLTIEPVAQLYISLWVNMTGQPSTLNRWLGGASVNGVASPAGPNVGETEITAYLAACNYFVLHPRNLVHMHDSVAAACPLLPTAVAAA